MSLVVAWWFLLVAAEDVSPPVLAHTEAKVTVRDRDLAIEATISDESGVFDPVVLWRVGTDGPYSRAPLELVEGDVYRAVLPASVVVADIEYLIEAYDTLGNGPARHGSEELPVRVRVVAAAAAPPLSTDPAATPAAPPEEEGSSTLLYVGLGVGGAALAAVVVAAAVTAGVVIYVLMQPTDPPGDGEVTLVVDATSPVAAALTARGGP